MKKLSKVIVAACVLMFCISATVFAATAEFNTVLPENQSDNEVVTIKKESSKSYFTINITYLGYGTDKACAWAENDLGYNLSSNYVQVPVGSRNIPYSISNPSAGTNVTLNLDNPVVMTTEVIVRGLWTPN